MNESFPPIGTLRTPFKEKFGVPRQPLMMTEALGVLKMNPDPLYRTALNHLEQFSHVWLIFLFHQNGGKAWRPTIDPPRLDAPDTMGVFASRSPHRPNPIGLSAVKLERIDFEAAGGIEIHLSGVDILDGTPVLDLKPYLPYADRIAEANAGWATGEIDRYRVEFSPESLRTLDGASHAEHPRLRQLIEQMLEWDPRPTSQRRAVPLNAPESEGKRFAFRVLNLDVHWEVRRGSVYVVEIRTLAY
jgi:tRNA (adenine37-N6)-methyltransferase